MTTQKPTSRALIKRELDEDSHESSFANLSETNLKRVSKGAARGQNREPLAKVFLMPILPLLTTFIRNARTTSQTTAAKTMKTMILM